MSYEESPNFTESRLGLAVFEVTSLSGKLFVGLRGSFEGSCRLVKRAVLRVWLKRLSSLETLITKFNGVFQSSGCDGCWVENQQRPLEKQLRLLDVKFSHESEECAIVLYRLSDCGVTDEGCAALASALRSNPSHLRKLDLSENNLGDSGVKMFSAVLENPHCKLEDLRLRDCGVTDEGWAALASALRSNLSHLRNLEMSLNKLGDSGVKLLSAVLENPHCNLEDLRLMDCGVTDEGCAALASALRSNPSHLRELNLSRNKLGDSGVKLLSDLTDDPHYKLQTLCT
ncbi:ribonuclease inhibitor-like [Megalobrama amblycephala]|uniref:ribonuclease inhibitor-like n=1 Tax=Megalobrama amblycephala TaxID=75352 RepID=UPI002014612E|nr:ribonuclease inhibitor-like [Megalobrama amblycephala]